MSRLAITLRLSALWVAALLAACASGGSRTVTDRMFLTAAASWDANRDDVTTCDEWKAYAGSIFDAADRSKAGSLSPEEFKTLEANDRMFSVADFKYFDSNGNGRVDRAEFVDKPNPAFQLADTDKDCRLTTMETTAARNMGTTKPAWSGALPQGSGGSY